MCDRLHLQRIGYDHSRNIRAEHPHHRHGVAGRLDDDLVFLAQTAAEPLKPRAGHVDPPGRTEPACFPENHLRESAVDVHADHTLHLLLLSLVVRREQWATRQLRIRAHGATGWVAGAASY